MSSSAKRVVLLMCGSFNPVTNAHLRMFETARDALWRERGVEVAYGVMSPVSDLYKKAGLLPSHHRVEMTRRALQSSDWVRVDDWEARQPTWSTTVTILRHFHEEAKAKEGSAVGIRLLCGGDLLETLDKPNIWAPEDVREILSHGLVCIERSGFDSRKFIFESDALSKLASGIMLVPEWIVNDISSTKVRRHLARGLSVKYFVQDSVIEYIREHGLYHDKAAAASSAESATKRVHAE